MNTVIIVYSTETAKELSRLLSGTYNGGRIELTSQPDWGIWANALSILVLRGASFNRFSVQGNRNEYEKARDWLKTRGPEYSFLP